MVQQTTDKNNNWKLKMHILLYNLIRKNFFLKVSSYLHIIFSYSVMSPVRLHCFSDTYLWFLSLRDTYYLHYIVVVPDF